MLGGMSGPVTARRREVPRILVPEACRRIGISRSRVRTELGRGTWRRLCRGVVLTRPDEPTRSDWALVGLLLAGETSALSGWDAVRLYGLGPKAAPAQPVLVLTDRGRSRHVGGVLVRRTDRPYGSSRRSVHDPLLPLERVVLPARAVADAALSYRTVGPVRAMTTAAVQRRLCTVGELREELRTAPRQHSALFRRGVMDAAGGAHSIAEAEAADFLRRADVPPFEMNVAVVDAGGTVLFVVDFLWRALRAALEVDSREFHAGYDEWQDTLARHNRLTAAGLAVTHYPPKIIRSRGPSWAAEVREWLACRATDLGLSVAVQVGEPRGAAGLDRVEPPPYVIDVD